jgi:hypothetical protein
LSASSGVITPLARPRIPSVPKYLRAIDYPISPPTIGASTPVAGLIEASRPT